MRNFQKQIVLSFRRESSASCESLFLSETLGPQLHLTFCLFTWLLQCSLSISILLKTIWFSTVHSLTQEDTSKMVLHIRENYLIIRIRADLFQSVDFSSHFRRKNTTKKQLLSCPQSPSHTLMLSNRCESPAKGGVITMFSVTWEQNLHTS